MGALLGHKNAVVNKGGAQIGSKNALDNREGPGASGKQESSHYWRV